MEHDDTSVCKNIIAQCDANQSNFEHDYLNLLQNNSDDIIQNLGGLHKIVQHCLKDPTYVKNNLKTDNLSNLQQLLTLEKRNHNDQILTLQSMSVRSIDIASIHGNPTSTATSKVLRMNDYIRHIPKITIDATNNLCFKWFPTNIAMFLFYKILLTHIYTIVMLVLFAILVLVLVIIQVLIKNIWYNIVYVSIMTFTEIVIWLYSVSILLGVNISIVKRIMNTFDFWFKMYNLLLITICELLMQVYFKLDDDPLFLSIIYGICICTILIVLFVIDAVYLSDKLKLCLTSFAGLLLFWFAIVRYFYSSNDTNINPFYNNKYSNINIRDVLIGLYVNVAINTRRIDNTNGSLSDVLNDHDDMEYTR